jgi:hypothetical protein
MAGETNYTQGPGAPKKYSSSAWQQQMVGGATDDFGNLQGGQTMYVNPYTGEQISAQEFQAMVKAESDAKMLAQGMNPDGSPVRPEYQSLLDPATGLLRSEYISKPGTLDVAGLQGFQELKKRALTAGPSAWGQMMTDKQRMEEAQQKDAAARQAMAGAAQARSALAMKGGLSSGAGERLAAGGARDLMLQRQGVASQGQMARQGINLEDEAQRMKLLPQVSEAEAKLSQYNLGLQNTAADTNILRALEEKRAKDSQDLAVYQEQIKKWAAERTAQATERAPSGGGGGK